MQLNGTGKSEPLGSTLPSPCMKIGVTGTCGRRAGQMADSRLEGLQGFRLSARAFREQHEDIAAIERVLEIRQRIALQGGGARPAE